MADDWEIDGVNRMNDTNELADSESNKANRLADLEPAAEVAPEESAFDSVAIVHSDLEPGTDLYAAEDIIQLIEEQIERHEEEHEEVRECNIDDCPYDRDTDEHLDEELMIVGRKQSLKALKSRICSLEVED